MLKLDDTYKILQEKLDGRKPKYVLLKDGKKYIYKFGSINLEIVAELLAEKIGLQVGINMAHYTMAAADAEIGVLSPSFLEDGELLIQSNEFKEYMSDLIPERILRVNTIKNLITAISMSGIDIDEDKTAYDLIQRWCFYNLILESDKNATNIALIKNNQKKWRLSPDYDNSSMCQLNKNINGIISSLSYSNEIYSYIDNIKCSLLYTDEAGEDFIDQFEILCKEHPQIVSSVLQNFENIDVYKAVDEVEQDNGIKLETNTAFWVRKCIGIRLSDMKAAFQRVTAQEDGNQVISKKSI